MIGDNKVLGLIPARGGSRRVPGKNLQQLGESSLLEITIGQAFLSKLIDKVVVSSEDAAILDTAEQAGACPLVRPLSLAQDETPGIDPVIHALRVFDNYSYIVLLQVTSPFRLVEDIDNAVRLCFDKQAPACVSVCQPLHHPAWMFNKTDNGTLQPLLTGERPQRSQDLPPCYVINGAVYVAEKDALLETNSFITADTIACEMPVDRSLDIDTEYDLQLARAVWALRN